MLKKKYNRLDQLLQLQYPNSDTWYNFNKNTFCNKFDIGHNALHQILKNGMFLHNGEIYRIKKFIK